MKLNKYSAQTKTATAECACVCVCLWMYESHRLRLMPFNTDRLNTNHQVINFIFILFNRIMCKYFPLMSLEQSMCIHSNVDETKAKEQWKIGSSTKTMNEQSFKFRRYEECLRCIYSLFVHKLAITHTIHTQVKFKCNHSHYFGIVNQYKNDESTRPTISVEQSGSTVRIVSMAFPLYFYVWNSSVSPVPTETKKEKQN